MKGKKTFEDLFHDELRDILDGERQITKALPKMIKAASNPELKEILEKHLSETEGQIDRLEKIFSICEIPLRAKKCEAIQGLLEEGETLLSECEPSATCDAGIIASAQKVEHYEIATYGTLRTFAEVLDFDESAKLLQETLDEESDMDERLNSLSRTVNAEALDEFHETEA
jgi:ferritin-like metal-binding protein YciE